MNHVAILLSILVCVACAFVVSEINKERQLEIERISLEARIDKAQNENIALLRDNQLQLSEQIRINNEKFNLFLEEQN
jgi:cell division protein ZapA (FtsZ GTPase activity inhibitor)